MLADSLLANALLFALGQGIACTYLRTGLVRRGAALLVLGWVLADLALVCRLLLPEQRAWFLAAVVALQASALLSTAHLAWLWLRHRSPARRVRRATLYEQAVVHYLRDELEPAQRIWRALRREDPWDLASALSLASVLDRRGQPRRAAAMRRSARALDRGGSHADFIAEEASRAARRGKLQAG